MARTNAPEVRLRIAMFLSSTRSTQDLAAQGDAFRVAHGERTTEYSIEPNFTATADRDGSMERVDPHWNLHDDADSELEVCRFLVYHILILILLRVKERVCYASPDVERR